MSKYRVKQIAWTQNHSAISTTTTIITGCVYKPDNAVDKQWLERAAFPAPPSSFLFISLSAHFRGNIQKRYPTRSRSIGPTLFYSTVASPSTECIECRVTRLSLWKEEGELSLNGRSLFVPFTVDYDYCWCSGYFFFLIINRFDNFDYLE